MCFNTDTVLNLTVVNKMTLVHEALLTSVNFSGSAQQEQYFCANTPILHVSCCMVDGSQLAQTRQKQSSVSEASVLHLDEKTEDMPCFVLTCFELAC